MRRAELQYDPDVLETESNASRLLEVKPRTLQEWRRTGRGPRFVRISHRCVRYRRRDLIAFIEARLVGGAG